VTCHVISHVIGYQQFADEQELPRLLAQLSARTLVIDVEPLVAYWDGSQQELDRGLARVLAEVTPIPGVVVVCFATNSARRPSAEPRSTTARVVYLRSAGKPAQTSRYRAFPRPGVVIGDQILTDGLLARRLRYTFLHYLPPLAGAPVGPQLASRSGRLLRPLLFPRPK
jgi:predicted HAD superfamily phosphohydrolase YqeG